MGKFKLAFGLHNHQPVGNFDFVFEEAHQKAYRPFLELVKNYPDIKFSLHQSGILWDWQKQHHPDYLKEIKELAHNNQIELLSGGFYEPILSSIPEHDIKNQIALLNNYIVSNFNKSPIGMWLTERIWEPHLPKVLNQSGIKYLPVDDTHFIYAGLEQSQLTGPFITEFENYSLTLLPISKQLRYLIPFGTIENLIDYIKRQAEQNPEGMLIYADDGEKFGSWPKTHEHCYGDRWLNRFFDAVMENSDWLEIVPLEKAAAVKPVGRVYLPSASYAEMLHWALPTKAFVEYENFENYLKEQNLYDNFGRFVRGGHWRGFLIKYEEANLMHKKMMMVSSKLSAFEKDNPDKSFQLNSAKEKLYAAQCNCPYWHGVFGGLYLPHIRQAVYSNLVEADNIINSLSNLTVTKITTDDFDKDGHDEIIIQNQNFTSIFKPDNGGMMVELSLNKHNFSLTDTLMRRKEGYHQKLDQAVTSENDSGTASIHDLVLAKEEGLKDLLTEDKYLKRCFIDHLFDKDMDFSKFNSGDFNNIESLFDKTYDCKIIDSNSIALSYLCGSVPVKIVKQFKFINDTIEVEYQLTTTDNSELEINFAIENSFNFQAGHAEDRYVLIDGNRGENSYLDSSESYNDVNNFSMLDEYRNLGIALSGDIKSEIWHLPIHTVSLSEGGFEKVYQGTTFVNRFKLLLSINPQILNFKLTAGNVKQVKELISSQVPTVNHLNK